jgi:hypothetical protein
MNIETEMMKLKEWCMQTYLEKSGFYDWLKVLIPILVIFVGSCVGYALVNNSNMSAAQATLTEHSEELKRLNNIQTDITDVKAMLTEEMRFQKLNRIRSGIEK